MPFQWNPQSFEEAVAAVGLMRSSPPLLVHECLRYVGLVGGELPVPPPHWYPGMVCVLRVHGGLPMLMMRAENGAWVPTPTEKPQHFVHQAVKG